MFLLISIFDLYIEAPVLPHVVHQCLSPVYFVLRFVVVQTKHSPLSKYTSINQMQYSHNIQSSTCPQCYHATLTMLYTTLQVLVYVRISGFRTALLHPLDASISSSPPTPTGSLHPNGLVLGINRWWLRCILVYFAVGYFVRGPWELHHRTLLRHGRACPNLFFPSIFPSCSWGCGPGNNTRDSGLIDQI